MKLPINEFAIDVPIEHLVLQYRDEITKQFDEAKKPFFEACKTRIDRDLHDILFELRNLAASLADIRVREQVEVIVSQAISETLSVNAIKRAVHVAIQQEIESSLAARPLTKVGPRRRSAHAGTVDELELSLRPANALKAEGINTIEQLSMLTEAELLKFPNCGQVSVKQIIEMLAKRGIILAK